MDTRVIKKEELNDIRFTTNEVIEDECAKKALMADLHRAQSLGNLEKNKVKITFHMEDSSKGEVETTVWGVCENYLTLKGSIHIPIRAIESVIFV